MLGTTIAIVFVLGVLALAVYALFELSPFAHHADSYRDNSGRLQVENSPHMETRDEFEGRGA